MKKIILSLILILNLFCVFAETGYNGLYWGMPEEKAYWEMDFLNPMNIPDERIKIYTESKTKEKYFFLGESLCMILRESCDSDIDNLIIKKEIEKQQMQELLKSIQNTDPKYYEKLDIYKIYVEYTLMLFFAPFISLSEMFNSVEPEKEVCIIEIYQYNEDSTLLKIKNYFDKDIEIISINVFDYMKKEFEKTKD